jgi:outer membrane protein insertion porin family
MRRGIAVLVLTHLAVSSAVAQPSGVPPPPLPVPEAPPSPVAQPAGELPAHDVGGGIRYLVEAVLIQGNRKTDPGLINRELGIAAGDVLTPDDARVRAAELRLLSLGYFLGVRLRLRRAQHQRGAVILIVEVEERGTTVLNALYLGTSEATLLWGGLDVSETNFLGRGITLGGGFVQSTTPTVPEAEAGHAFTLRAAGPPRRDGLMPAGSLIYSEGSEFFQAFGAEDEVDPTKWRALNTTRLGGSLSIGGQLSRTVRFTTEGRFESIQARLPSIRSRDLGGTRARPIDFYIHEGSSRLAALTAVLDFDTRSDPVLPSSGRRIAVSIEAALPVMGSRYSYAKGTTFASFYFPVFGRHVLAVHAFAGAIMGEAPYFNRFFVGDLNFLLPPRALGLNFATLPSRNLLGTTIAGKRYESFAGRTVLEYSVPLWRKRGFVYRGDAFAAFGLFGLASLDDLRLRDSAAPGAVPVDLTADLGVKLDTHIGIFTLSLGNGLGRIPR